MNLWWRGHNIRGRTLGTLCVLLFLQIALCFRFIVQIAPGTALFGLAVLGPLPLMKSGRAND